MDLKNKALQIRIYENNTPLLTGEYDFSFLLNNEDATTFIVYVKLIAWRINILKDNKHWGNSRFAVTEYNTRVNNSVVEFQGLIEHCLMI